MTRGTPILETVTLHVPFRVVKRGGRKEMQLPDGAAQPCGPDSTLVKALARARPRRGDPGRKEGAIGDAGAGDGAFPDGVDRPVAFPLEIAA